MLLFLSSFVKVSQRVEELLSEHDLTDRQTDGNTDRQTDKLWENYMPPPDKGDIINKSASNLVTNRQNRFTCILSES